MSSLVKLILYCLLVLVTVQNAFGINPEVPGSATKEAAAIAAGEKKLGEQILLILEHFKQENPMGLPGVEIPDPMPIPDMRHSFPVGTMNFKNSKIHGLSKFKILYVKSEISSMEVNAAMIIDKVQCIGNYTLSTWLSRSNGPFTVNLTDVYAQGVANLAIERDGKLRAQDIKMDITFKSISLNFENLGLVGSMFQGIVNSIGSFLFDSIKPIILKEAYTKIRAEINTNLEKVAGDIQFPNSISPIDMIITDARKKVRDMGYDPYKVDDYNSTSGMFGIQLSKTWIYGISSFYRVGNMSLSMSNNTLIADIEIGTQALEGQTHWDVSAIGGIMSRAGTASFTIEFITAKIIIGQPLDTRKKPEFRDLQIEIGNIQARCDGAGTLDYILEFIVNVIPNLLRYQIMDALEGPVEDKVQQMFNQINVEEVIKSKIPELEQSVEHSGFKLSILKSTSDTTAKKLEDNDDDDSFWNFD